MKHLECRSTNGDPEMKLWRYGVVCTTLKPSTAEVWRTYRGRTETFTRLPARESISARASMVNLTDFACTTSDTRGRVTLSIRAASACVRAAQLSSRQLRPASR